MGEPEKRIALWKGKAESASEYDHGIGIWVTRREAELILELIGKPAGPILDFPCGSGRLSTSLVKAGHRVIAADLLPDMAAFTKHLIGQRVLQANIFEPPFRPGTFDTILAARIFFHYPDQGSLLKALAVLLAPGGRLIFDTLNPLSTRRALALILNMLRRERSRRLVFSKPAVILSQAKQVGLKLEIRKRLHLFPTRIYQFLPHSLLPLLLWLEQRLPKACLVSTFWAFSRQENKGKQLRGS